MRIHFLTLLILVLTACTPRLIPAPAPTQIATATQVPLQGDTPDMDKIPSPPAAPGLQGMIENAKANLATRLSIAVEQINLVDVTEVEWSDSSLDCPQPDMSYLQVITQGYRILLDANAQVYEYHSNKDTYVVYCENPENLIPPI